MTYRDDQDALVQRVGALEQQARRAEQLERRVTELEAENRELRAAATIAASPVAQKTVEKTPMEPIYVDAKIRDYIAALVQATRAPVEHGVPALAPHILSGARDSDMAEILEATRAYASDAGRRYVVPEDVKTVAPDVLRQRIILTGDARAAGMTVEQIVDQILDWVEVP